MASTIAACATRTVVGWLRLIVAGLMAGLALDDDARFLDEVLIDALAMVRRVLVGG